MGNNKHTTIVLPKTILNKTILDRLKYDQVSASYKNYNIEIMRVLKNPTKENIEKLYKYGDYIDKSLIKNMVRVWDKLDSSTFDKLYTKEEFLNTNLDDLE